MHIDQGINKEWKMNSHIKQGYFCEYAQPMGDDVTLYRRLSLTARIHKMIREQKN